MNLALEVLTDLNERITSAKKERRRPSGEIYHPDNMNGSILRVDRGKSFKGHDASVNICHEGRKLFIHNKYFSGMVASIFYTDSKTTELNFQHNYDSPKWMEQKYKDVTNYHNLIEDRIDFEVDDNTMLYISEWGVQVTKNIEIDGLNMFGHKYNIQMLRELQEVGSKFRKHFKKMDINRLVFKKRSKDDSSNKVIGW